MKGDTEITTVFDKEVITGWCRESADAKSGAADWLEIDFSAVAAAGATADWLGIDFSFVSAAADWLGVTPRLGGGR